MEQMMNYPVLICIVALVCLWAIALLGLLIRKGKKTESEAEREEFGIVLSATLTLLGLLIGFSFSMAINRYDQRKNYEEEEANAIGTEYLRADLLSEPVRQKVKAQLVEYLDLRIRKYQAHASENAQELGLKTARLQQEMWDAVEGAAAARTDPVMAAVVTGMNDVINRQGYTQAARWNRIPLPAWGLMAAIALFSNFLVGYRAEKRHTFLLLIVPLAIAVSFLLIADIDSPNGGVIRVAPQNLIALAESLRPR